VQAASINSVVKPEMTRAKKFELTDSMLSPADKTPNMKQSFAVKEFCLFEFSTSGITYTMIGQAAESFLFGFKG